MIALCPGLTSYGLSPRRLKYCLSSPINKCGHCPIWLYR